MKEIQLEGLPKRGKEHSNESNTYPDRTNYIADTSSPTYRTNSLRKDRHVNSPIGDSAESSAKPVGMGPIATIGGGDSTRPLIFEHLEAPGNFSGIKQPVVIA